MAAMEQTRGSADATVVSLGETLHPELGGTRVRPEPGLRDPRPAPIIDLVQLDPDGSRLAVVGINEPHQRLHSLTVEDGVDHVSIAAFVGTPSSAASSSATADLRSLWVSEVHLGRALDGRRIHIPSEARVTSSPR